LPAALPPTTWRRAAANSRTSAGWPRAGPCCTGWSETTAPLDHPFTESVSRERNTMFSGKELIADFDAEVWAAIEAENTRQEEHIELIASENYVSPRVMQAQGTQLINKYAEGYPGKRYYGGCEHVDIVEQLAIDRA